MTPTLSLATATSVYDPPDQPEVAELYGEEASQQWLLAQRLAEVPVNNWEDTEPMAMIHLS